jgi:hypothetical protein
MLQPVQAAAAVSDLVPSWDWLFWSNSISIVVDIQ